MATKENEIPIEKQLELIFSFGGYPLWQYLQEVLNLEDIGTHDVIEPLLITTNGKLAARNTDAPVKLSNSYNNDVIFIINAINTVFESVKIEYEQGGVKILEMYKFKIGSENELFLVDADENRLSDKSIAVIMVESDEDTAADKNEERTMENENGDATENQLSDEPIVHAE